MLLVRNYAILSKDGTHVENIILAYEDDPIVKDLLCCDGMEIGVGWKRDIDGKFYDPTPIVTTSNVSDYEEITLSDEEISNLLRLIQEDEARS